MIRRRRRSRGQSLVEFALVLPILLMLTLITLDFGRIYLGYINLQNMARIAANFAANNPDAWNAPPDAAARARYAAAQTRYNNQILADAVASNCVLPKVNGVTTVPIPTFIDTNGGGVGLGDTAEVQISCTFGVITPVIANIVGGSVTVSAASSFPVKSGMSATGAGGAPSAAFSGNGVIHPSPLSGIAPFVVDFRDTSGGNPSAWAWTFNDGTAASTAQDPGQHRFDNPGTYVVSMTAWNALGSSAATMGVTVVSGTTVNFTADRQSGNAPLTVQFTDTSTSVGTAYAWTFGADEGTSTLQHPSWNYTTPGTYTVTLTVTYPSPTGDLMTSKTGFITVNCLVPSLNGVKRNDAQATWQGYNFTGTVSDGPGAPTGNYTITTQSLVAGASAPCNSNVVVNRPNPPKRP